MPYNRRVKCSVANPFLETNSRLGAHCIFSAAYIAPSIGEKRIFQSARNRLRRQGFPNYLIGGTRRSNKLGIKKWKHSQACGSDPTSIAHLHAEELQEKQRAMRMALKPNALHWERNVKGFGGVLDSGAMPFYFAFKDLEKIRYFDAMFEKLGGVRY